MVIKFCHLAIEKKKSYKKTEVLVSWSRIIIAFSIRNKLEWMKDDDQWPIIIIQWCLTLIYFLFFEFYVYCIENWRIATILMMMIILNFFFFVKIDWNISRSHLTFFPSFYLLFCNRFSETNQWFGIKCSNM